MVLVIIIERIFFTPARAERGKRGGSERDRHNRQHNLKHKSSLAKKYTQSHTPITLPLLDSQMKCVFIFVWVLPCTHTHTHAHTQSWCILRIIVVVVLFWRGIRNHFQTFFVFIGRCDSQGILFGGLRNTHKGKAPLIYSMYRIFMCLVPANIVKHKHLSTNNQAWRGEVGTFLFSIRITFVHFLLNIKSSFLPFMVA